MEFGGIAFDDNRKAIIRSDESKDFQAVPGSGKTTLLVSKLLLIASKWDFTDCGICVLSHTNVAKDEIKKKITESGLGKELLKYPHFIGTIQEFVDKYLAYPAVRHLGYKIRIVDTELAREKIEFSLTYGTKTWLANQHKSFDLKLTSVEPLAFIMPDRLSETTATYQDLYTKKKNSLECGYFFYDDMYAFANYALEMYPDYIRNVRGRFPLVFIDEAQDNDNKQDVLLESIFNDQSCIYQRFGDSDQAIYDFNGANGQNTFGASADRQSSININDSKRFPAKHLDLINIFKLSSIGLTALSNEPKIVPQVITYSATTKSQVISNFLDLIDIHFESRENPIVKIVGFVATPNQQSHIGVYIENYKKTRKTDKLDTLIELVYSLRDTPKLELNKAFYQIVGFIIKKHDIQHENDILHPQKKSSIRAFLQEKDSEGAFKAAVLDILANPITEISWQSFYRCICTTFSITTIHASISQFVLEEYTTPTTENTDATITRCDNSNCIYTPIKNIKVEIDTIHGVKGETHDATLVLETTHKRMNDVSCCIANLTSANKDKFKKQLYVATTRARSLLCIAVENTTSIGVINNIQTVAV
jgi:superfamily I DNA/RNA helicase